MKAYRIIPVILALALAGPAQAQEPERERKRQIEEAQRIVEEAQQRLKEALERLRSDEAMAALRDVERAMRELRMAQRRLRGDRVRQLIERIEVRRPGGEVVLAAGGRPMMGVVLRGSAPERDSIGAELAAVSPGGPSDEAGLKAGDIVIRANGQSLARRNRRDRSPGDKLVEMLRGLDDGDTLHLDYRRDGEARSAAVVVREMDPWSYSFSIGGDSGLSIIGDPGDFEVIAPRVDIGPAPRISALLPLRWLDIELVKLDEELGRYFGTSEGLLVVRAPRDESLGLQSGDVILSIDGRAPASPSHAIRILRSYEAGESMTIEIMRDRRKRTVTATVPEGGRGFFRVPERR